MTARLALRLAAVACVSAQSIAAFASDPFASLPVYEPRDVRVPPDAAYLERDGAITIVGYNDMEGMLGALNDLFARTHPGFTFRLRLHGTATAAPSLAHGVSAFAPMGAEFSRLELDAYRAIVGREPQLFRVAHAAIDPRARSAPIGLYVHRTNPLDSLTVGEISRIFTTGLPGGDIATWGQVGLAGEWRQRPIHVYGIAEEASAGLVPSMRQRVGERAFVPGYRGLAQSTDVVAHVALDPAGIGFAAGNIDHADAKRLAIAATAGAAAVHISSEDIVAGRYPFDRYLLIYVRRVEGAPLDSWVKEYLLAVYSREGQRAIAHAAPGYLPLNAREVAVELAKLD